VATPRHYELLGVRAIGELVDQESAVVWPEVEAKIADRTWPGLTTKIDPHHLTTAKIELVEAGDLVSTTAATRGGRRIAVLHRPVERGVARATIDASGRKRLLHARYVSWATGSKTGGEGAIGPGLEGVVHSSLREAAPYGYRLFNPASGEVRHLFGQPVAGGPLDNGALLTRVDAETLMPDGQYVVVVEVKNLRQWIYPRTQELHQLLDKAARFQVAHPERRFVPVLVCRKAHYLTTMMAQQVGFYVIQTHRQYVRPFLADTEEGRRYLGEVNSELGYDLVPESGPVTPMVEHFRSPLQRVADRTAERWAAAAGRMSPILSRLRDDSLTYVDRAAYMDQLAVAAADVFGEHPRWHGL
jgi:hypothetical protein